MKKYVRGGILCFLIITVLFALTFGNATAAPVITTPVAENTIPRVTSTEEYINDEFLYYTEQNTPEECLIAIHQCEDYIIYLNGVLPQDSKELRQEIEWISTQISLHHTRYITLMEEKAKWAKRAEEYPNATRIWLYMKNNFGWSDEVCAGVIGNIMGEIGRDMKFEKWNHDKPYGMFQWLGQRRKDIHKIYGEEPSIEEQLEFMYDELYGTDGVRKQVKDWQREKILTSETPEDAAMAFCRYFERPGGTGLCRKGYARTAYEYFTN